VVDYLENFMEEVKPRIREERREELESSPTIEALPPALGRLIIHTTSDGLVGRGALMGRDAARFGGLRRARAGASGARLPTTRAVRLLPSRL
jgi:hypothetical protein